MYVADLNSRAAAESLSLLVQGHQAISYEQVYEVRETIEVQTAQLASLRATDAELADLRAAVDHLEAAPTGEAFAVADADFHLLIAQLTHNPLFTILLEAIGDVMMDVRRESAYLRGARQHVTADHQRIAAAIGARDPQSAGQLVAEHLEHSRDIVRNLDRSADVAKGRERHR